MPDLVVDAIIEVPRGSQNKYEWDPATGRMTLDRVLFSPMFYPGEYGFIDQTLAEDGDPLDILVLSTYPTFPGCRVPARVVGVMEMSDEKGPDLKILAVVAVDPRWEDVRSLEDVPHHVRKEIEHFFLTYKELEAKRVEVQGWQGIAAAEAALADARQRYRAQGQ